MNSFLKIIDNPFFFQRKYFLNILLIVAICYQGNPFKRDNVVPDNAFVEGVFTTKNLEETYSFTVSQISKNDYESNPSKENVVNDYCCPDKYYSVILKNETKSFTYSFFSLKSKYFGSNSIYYYDIYENHIYPDNGNACYQISYKNDESELILFFDRVNASEK